VAREAEAGRMGVGWGGHVDEHTCERERGVEDGDGMLGSRSNGGKRSTDVNRFFQLSEK
jgi:hypothetical protein